jgi:maltooligosyltrehalose trehalohydrolase
MPSKKEQARPPMGATQCTEGTCFRIWAPRASKVEALILRAPSLLLRTVPLTQRESGWFEGMDGEGAAGDLYKLRLDDHTELPDPASRWQPEGPHGPSMVIDGSIFQWNDAQWQSPPLRRLVIYELHVGVFTPEGTFAAAIGKLTHLKNLGVTAIELMPLAEFAGKRNWGYDGTCLYAPSHWYGHPDELRALVNAAHQHGIAVILDVVYNHFGPDGNYLETYAGSYLDESAKTPWGGAIRYGEPDFVPLRQMLVANVQYWMEDFHIDGFRLDAIHAIQDQSSVHILQEITSAVHAKGGLIIAEDNRNEASVCEAVNVGGMGFDAVWADDFHHVTRVGQTQETTGYYQDYSGTIDELFEVLRSGWLYQGQVCKTSGASRGTACGHLMPASFVTCISNHDQVGNRAFGERLHHTISAEAYRALSALLCLSPFTPLLFMGQEWAASTPFQFFTDHKPELGALITEGRRKEFAAFPQFQGEGTTERIPDPQEVATFERSKLRWVEVGEKPHSQVLLLYQECLRLRAQIPLLSTDSRRGFRVEKLAGPLLVMHYDGIGHGHTVIAHLGKERVTVPLDDICPNSPHRLMLSSNENRFGGTKERFAESVTNSLDFDGPEVIVVER